MRADVQAQYIARRIDFMRKTGEDNATITKKAVEIFDQKWQSLEDRMGIVPGKSVLSRLREEVTRLYSVNLTEYRIVSEFSRDEVPNDLWQLLRGLDIYRQAIPR